MSGPGVERPVARGTAAIQRRHSVLVVEVGRQVVDDLDDGDVGVQLGEPLRPAGGRARRHGPRCC